MESVVAEFAFMATAAGKAFVILMDPVRLMYLAAGCVMGLVLGIVPPPRNCELWPAMSPDSFDLILPQGGRVPLDTPVTIGRRLCLSSCRALRLKIPSRCGWDGSEGCSLNITYCSGASSEPAKPASTNAATNRPTDRSLSWCPLWLESTLWLCARPPK